MSEKASSVPPRETGRGSVSNAARWVILMAARCPNSKKILQIMWNGRLMPIIPLYLEVTVPRTGNQNLAKTRLKKQKLPRLMSLSTWFSKAYGCTLVNVEVLVLRNILVPRTNLRDIGPA